MCSINCLIVHIRTLCLRQNLYLTLSGLVGNFFITSLTVDFITLTLSGYPVGLTFYGRRLGFRTLTRVTYFYVLNLDILFVFGCIVIKLFFRLKMFLLALWLIWIYLQFQPSDDVPEGWVHEKLQLDTPPGGLRYLDPFWVYCWLGFVDVQWYSLFTVHLSTPTKTHCIYQNLFLTLSESIRDFFLISITTQYPSIQAMGWMNGINEYSCVVCRFINLVKSIWGSTRALKRLYLCSNPGKCIKPW